MIILRHIQLCEDVCCSENIGVSLVRILFFIFFVYKYKEGLVSQQGIAQNSLACVDGLGTISQASLTLPWM